MSFRDLSTQELIDLCINNKDRKAWDEFFRRYLKIIINGIKDTFKNKNRDDFAKDRDIVIGIHHKVITKLCYKNILTKCEDLSGIENWLHTVASNQTIDWLEKRGRDKRIVETTVIDSTIALPPEELLYKRERDKRDVEATDKNTRIPLPDDIKIAPPVDFTDVFNKEKEDESESCEVLLKKKLDDTKNEKDRWILRVSIMYVLPLDDQEMDALSKFSGLSLRAIKEGIVKIIDDVKKKEDVKTQNASDAIKKYFQNSRLQGMLADERKNTLPYNQERIRKLEVRLQRNIKIRTHKLKTINKVSWPSNKLIAEILGLDKKQEGQISIRRLRKKENKKS